MWTDERVSTLRQLWADGLSGAVIAKQMNAKSRNAIIGKAHRLKLPRRKTHWNVKWSADETAQLRKLWTSGATGAAIEKKLGRTRDAVLGKIRRLGLVRKEVAEHAGPYDPRRDAKPAWLKGAAHARS